MASLLEIKGLTTRVSGFTILNNLDFSIEENELRVLLGPNGAGKTTLICMITGQFKPACRIDPLRRPGHHRLGTRRDLPGRHQPQVPSAQHVRDPVGVRQRHGLAARPTTRVCHVVSAAERRGAGPHLGNPGIRRTGGQGERPCGFAVPRRAPMARARHADRVQSEAAAAGRADHRHDRGGQAQDGGADPQDRRRRTPCCWSSTICTSFVRSGSASPCCIRGKCWPRAPSAR